MIPCFGWLDAMTVFVGCHVALVGLFPGFYANCCQNGKKFVVQSCLQHIFDAKKNLTVFLILFNYF